MVLTVVLPFWELIFFVAAHSLIKLCSIISTILSRPGPALAAISCIRQHPVVDNVVRSELLVLSMPSSKPLMPVRYAVLNVLGAFPLVILRSLVRLVSLWVQFCSVSLPSKYG